MTQLIEIHPVRRPIPAPLEGMFRGTETKDPGTLRALAAITCKKLEEAEGFARQVGRIETIDRHLESLLVAVRDTLACSTGNLNMSNAGFAVLRRRAYALAQQIDEQLEGTIDVEQITQLRLDIVTAANAEVERLVAALPGHRTTA